MTREEKKVVVISGGMGAVGQTTAVAMLAEGYRVVLLYRNTPQTEIDIARDSWGKGVLFIRCDLGHGVEVQSAIQTVVDHFGHIDVCIHTAVAAIERKKIFDLDELAFRGQFEASFFGAFNLFKFASTVMRERNSGILIAITSVVAEPGVRGTRMGAYTTAKLALRGLLRELYFELRQNGVRVLAVAPDIMKTPLNNDLPDKYFEFAQMKLDKNLLTPVDVAHAVVYLCSPEGAELNGISLLVETMEATPL